MQVVYVLLVPYTCIYPREKNDDKAAKSVVAKNELNLKFCLNIKNKITFQNVFRKFNNDCILSITLSCIVSIIF